MLPSHLSLSFDPNSPATWLNCDSESKSITYTFHILCILFGNQSSHILICCALIFFFLMFLFFDFFTRKLISSSALLLDFFELSVPFDMYLSLWDGNGILLNCKDGPKLVIQSQFVGIAWKVQVQGASSNYPCIERCKGASSIHPCIIWVPSLMILSTIIWGGASCWTHVHPHHYLVNGPIPIIACLSTRARKSSHRWGCSKPRRPRMGTLWTLWWFIHA